MANFFEQFHDTPEQAAPGGTANYFSQFHPEGEAAPKRVIIDTTPKRPDNGMGDALIQGVKQGATAGFSDELQGLSEAGGATEHFNGIQHLLTGFAKYLAGDPEAHAKYNATVEREREAIKAAEEHHGFMTGLGQVGGAIATLPMGGEWATGAKLTAEAVAAAKAGLPEAAALARSAFAARTAGAAKQGAVYGGLSGAGEGVGAKDTAIKAAGGTVLGGVVGGVAAPLVEGAGRLISGATQGIRNKYRGFKDSDAEAARQFATMYKADAEADPLFRNRLHPDEFHANPDARLMDLGGGGIDRLANRAAIESPGGEMKLKTAIDDRYKGQTNRFTDWFQSHFHYPDAYGQQQAIDEVAKKVNSPAYKAVMDANPVVHVPADITQRPVVAQAMKDAVSLARNYGEKLSGQPEVKTILSGPGYHIADDVANPAHTSLEYWDYVKKAIDARINGAKRHGGIEELNGKQVADYRGLVNAKNALVDHLDSVAKGYKEVRNGAAGFFGAENALEAGVKFVSDAKMGMTEARQIVGKMSPAERRLFQDGFVSEYLRAVINKTSDNRDVLLKIANNPEAKAKLELVMGPEKMKALEAKIRVEQIFQQIKKAVTGQSITAKNMHDLGMLGGGGLASYGWGNSHDPYEITSGLLVAGMAGGSKRINAQVATKLIDMMLSRDPMVVEKGFKLISSDPKWLGALRDADTKIGRVFSEAAPTNTALQLTGAVRADDQPGVKRPVNK